VREDNEDNHEQISYITSDTNMENSQLLKITDAGITTENNN
jgi:hypothetical protein